MNSRIVQRVSCQSCGLQFEPSGRSSRCPICRTRVRSAIAAPPRPQLSRGRRITLVVGGLAIAVVAAIAVLHIAAGLVVLGALVSLGIAEGVSSSRNDGSASEVDPRYAGGYEYLDAHAGTDFGGGDGGGGGGI